MEMTLYISRKFLYFSDKTSKDFGVLNIRDDFSFQSSRKA